MKIGKFRIRYTKRMANGIAKYLTVLILNIVVIVILKSVLSGYINLQIQFPKLYESIGTPEILKICVFGASLVSIYFSTLLVSYAYDNIIAQLFTISTYIGIHWIEILNTSTVVGKEMLSLLITVIPAIILVGVNVLKLIFKVFSGYYLIKEDTKVNSKVHNTDKDESGEEIFGLYPEDSKSTVNKEKEDKRKNESEFFEEESAGYFS